jgi:hypothetical protein
MWTCDSTHLTGKSNLKKPQNSNFNKSNVKWRNWKYKNNYKKNSKEKITSERMRTKFEKKTN